MTTMEPASSKPLCATCLIGDRRRTGVRTNHSSGGAASAATVTSMRRLSRSPASCTSVCSTLVSMLASMAMPKASMK